MDQLHPDRPRNPDNDVDKTRRRFLAGIVGGATLAYLSGCDSPEKPTPPPEIFAKDPSWRQNFKEMRDGSLDKSQWNAKLGPENGGGLQVYTDHTENVSVRNGALVITGLQQKIGGREYSSARIDTLGHAEFGFGRLVVRARLPKGVGPHAAIWMRHVSQEPGTPTRNGEIDIMEHVGVNGDKVYVNVHTADTVSTDANGLVTDHSGFAVPDASEDFHDYGVERTAAGITFTVDGRQVYHVPAPSGESSDEVWPFGEEDKYYLILNMAIGDNWGGKAGVDTNSDPWQMAIEDIAFYPALTK
jgi:beta-glucanase (GH16 family)